MEFKFENSMVEWILGALNNAAYIVVKDKSIIVVLLILLL